LSGLCNAGVYISETKQMHMKKLTLLATTIALTAISIQSCKKDDPAPTPAAPAEFIADDNTFAGFTSWTQTSTKLGKDPSLGEAHAGNDSTTVRKIWIKDNKNRENGKFPIGTLIVKHSKNASGTVDMYTAMVKRGNNFNPNNNDWEWFVITADGKIAKDGSNVMRGANLMNGMCGGCHSGAKDKDYVFTK